MWSIRDRSASRREADPAGADNAVVSRGDSRTWREHGLTRYGLPEVVPYPRHTQLPRAALFRVGDWQFWYDSAVSQAAHAVWLAATDKGRETAIRLLPARDAGPRMGSEILEEESRLPVESMAGIGEVCTPTFGTHGALTRLTIKPATRAPFPGRIWLTDAAVRAPYDPDQRAREDWTRTPYLTHAQLFSGGAFAGEPGTRTRWLCPQVPGTLLWWKVMAFSLTTPGNDVVLVDSRDVHWKETVLAAGATAMAATPGQWAWVAGNWGSEVSDIGLEEVVIAQSGPSPAAERWLRLVLPRARISYGW